MKKGSFYVWKLSAFVVFSMLFFSVAARAEAPVTANNMPVASQRAINEAQIQKFAALQIELDKINDEYAPRIEKAKTDKEKSQLNDEASDKMLKAIKDQGLTVAEYHRIAGAVIVENQTHQRVIEEINKLKGPASSAK